MTRITHADQVMLLLRERLARGGARAASRRPAGAAPADAAPIDRLRALAVLDALEDGPRRRAVVHALLLEEFGDEVANDPALQAVLDDVMRIIAAMPGGPELMDRAAAALRSP